MEVTMRKKCSLSSLIAAGTIALGVIGLYSPQGLVSPVMAEPISSKETNLVGTYGVDNYKGDYTKVYGPLVPGGMTDPGMGRSEDYLEFTDTKFNIGAEGQQTTFAWKTNFGTRDNADDITINILAGQNLFDNQGIYMGSRGEGTGGQTTLNILGGTNLFTQRVIVGGEGKGDNGEAGKSIINISGGTNVFTYNKDFDTKSTKEGDLLSLGRIKDKTVFEMTGITLNKYLGNNKFATISGYTNEDKDKAFNDLRTEDPEAETYFYGSINMYNYYNNYYGVFFSAMAEGKETDDGVTGHKTEGVNLTISGGKNIFNVATYIGGGYDDTPYCSVNTSSDDDDYVTGGTNNINITGGFTNFAGRTYFGAQGSSTTVNFTGHSTTYFSGTKISEDMDLALANAKLDVPGSHPAFTNEYRGGDLPYVFLGGKEGLSTTINVDGVSANMTTLDIQTSTFVGGADERWLAGDQYLQETLDGELIYTFRLTDDNATQSGDFKNGIRTDSGAATFNLKNGKVRLGYVNTTAIVKNYNMQSDDPTTYGRNYNNWNYKFDKEGEAEEGLEYGVVYDVIRMQDRYEQVRLIGAAAGSKFNATGGRIEFDVAVHAEQKNIIDTAKASGYSGYFTDEFAENDKATGVLNLEAAMIAFDQIHIGKDVDITVGGMGNLMARAEKETGTTVAGQKEYYTNAVFVDTTIANANHTFETTKVKFAGDELTLEGDETDVVADLDGYAKTKTDGDDTLSQYDNLVYDKWLYTIKLEDVDSTYADVEGIQTNEVRLHIQTKGGKLSDNYIGNIKNNSEAFTKVLLDGDSGSSVYNAIEQIANSSRSAAEAAQNFDQLAGTDYANYAANQIRRMTNFNSMMMDQILASDVCMKNIRSGCTTPEQRDACGNCRSWTAWGHFYGDGGKAQMHDYISGYNTNTYGGMFALDWTNCESCHFGVFFDYAKLQQDSTAPMGYTNINSNNYTVGLYAKWLGLFCTGGYGSIIATAGMSDMKSNRELYLDDSFNASTDGGILPTVFYERGWVFFPCERFSLNPFFNLQYAYFHNNSFTERGLDEVGDASDLALNVGKVDHHSLRTQVGLRINRDWMLGMEHDRRLTTRFKGAWLHDLLGACDPVITTSHVEEGSPTWHLVGNNSGRDWAILGAGIDFNATARLSFLVDYNCYVNEYTTIHSGMGTMRFSF